MASIERETEQVLSLQEQAFSCGDFEDLKRKVLAPTAEFVDAETSCFLQLSQDGQSQVQIGRTFAHNVSERAHADYVSHYSSSDPALEAAMLHQEDTPYLFCTSEVYDYDRLTHSELYSEFFRPNDIHHVMVMALRPQGRRGDTLILGFHRPLSDRPFDVKEKQKLQRLSSALSCSLRVLCLQDSVSMRDEALSEIGRVYPEQGLVLFDEQMSLLYGNSTGLQNLQIGKNHGASSRSRLDRLKRACRAAKSLEDRIDGVSADFSEGEDLIAKVYSRTDQSGRTLFAVHTNQRMAEAIFSARCRDYDFTPRELDITRAVAAGLSNLEIAEQLYISARTVENHLRSIYSKANVNRRTQLLCRLNAAE